MLCLCGAGWGAWPGRRDGVGGARLRSPPMSGKGNKSPASISLSEPFMRLVARYMSRSGSLSCAGQATGQGRCCAASGLSLSGCGAGGSAHGRCLIYIIGVWCRGWAAACTCRSTYMYMPFDLHVHLRPPARARKSLNVYVRPFLPIPARLPACISHGAVKVVHNPVVGATFIHFYCQLRLPPKTVIWSLFKDY